MKKLITLGLMLFGGVAFIQAQSQYNEDVSEFRPVYSVSESTTPETVDSTHVESDDSTIIENHKNKDVEKMSGVINSYYTNADDEIRGKRVQIYSGPSEVEANAARQKFLNIYGNKYPVYKKYVTPDFKVMVGDFVDRLESFRLYHDVVKDFKRALLVPYNVNFHKLK